MYSEQIKETVRLAPKTLGNQVVRWAIARDFSIIRISKATGATRQTVYNWAAGGECTNAYRERTQALLEILRAAPTGEEAWRKACRRFNLKD